MTINELAVLYNKIQDNTATEIEKMEYEGYVISSCVNQTVLLDAIKTEAEKLRKKRD